MYLLPSILLVKTSSVTLYGVVDVTSKLDVEKKRFPILLSDLD